MIRQLSRKASSFKHQVRCSAWNFQETMESRIPDFKGRPNRSGADLQKAKDALPKVVFMTSYEFDLLTKTRTNVIGEFGYQRDTRIKVSELMLKEAPEKLHDVHESNPEIKKFAELKALQSLSEYAGDLLEKQNSNVQRINDFVDSNPVYLLDQPLREEARWNLLEDMENRTRAAVRKELQSWLPAEYQQHRAADFQQVAAFSPEVRRQMLAKIDERAQSYESEISSLPAAEQQAYREILAANVAASKACIDPTHDITAEAISAAKGVDELRAMAHRVSEYNGDERLLAIYEKAASISGDNAAGALIGELKSVVYN